MFTWFHMFSIFSVCFLLFHVFNLFHFCFNFSRFLTLFCHVHLLFTCHGHFSFSVLCCPVLSRPVLSCPVTSRHVTSCPVLSCHVMSCHVMSCSEGATLAVLCRQTTYSVNRSCAKTDISPNSGTTSTTRGGNHWTALLLDLCDDIGPRHQEQDTT